VFEKIADNVYVMHGPLDEPNVKNRGFMNNLLVYMYTQLFSIDLTEKCRRKLKFLYPTTLLEHILQKLQVLITYNAYLLLVVKLI
jgi:hypothetical protein